MEEKTTTATMGGDEDDNWKLTPTTTGGTTMNEGGAGTNNNDEGDKEKTIQKTTAMTRGDGNSDGKHPAPALPLRAVACRGDCRC